ncbi:GMC oxidoreductase [Actinoplanes sp. NPDC051851]|uniref:GMC oxidoreductase n=1 Tax=Actinoplanes sp. NPDC051851 TaxID=3154753 RepID=UPI00341327D9
MTDVDLLIVGSGPAGSAIAREVSERRPGTRILMVDAGPQVTEVPGRNTRNLAPDERAVAQARSQGPNADGAASATGRVPGGRLAARPGTFLLREPVDGDDDQDGMPAAAMSSNVGGMSAHWTCACPRPGGTERIGFLPQNALASAFDRAEELLTVTQKAFRPSPSSEYVIETLGALYDQGREPDRRVQPMPLACAPSNQGPSDRGMPTWSGAAEVLGPLTGPADGFTLSPETVCRRILHTDGVATGAELIRNGQTETVTARVVVVAGDAIRTPQLLWASGIRPGALGRYLNDQPQVISAVILDVPGSGAAYTDVLDQRDLLTGVMWVPFDDASFPFHGQIMQLDASPILVGEDADPNASVVGIGTFGAKEPRAEDRVTFDEDRLDGYGLPAPTIHYGLTEKDRAGVSRARGEISRMAAALGRFVPGGEPKLLPAGSSMHYQGSVRMGPADDGTSTCDSTSKIWGTANVFVAGNGVIPTATACNPTLTAVALAVLAAEQIAAELGALADAERIASEPGA